jgi:hypothetical protein
MTRSTRNCLAGCFNYALVAMIVVTALICAALIAAGSTSTQQQINQALGSSYTSSQLANDQVSVTGDSATVLGLNSNGSPVSLSRMADGHWQVTLPGTQ